MKPRALVAEFIGTFVLCFAGIGAICAGSLPGGGDLVAVALAHGLAIFVMGTAYGAISGGHFNPAVSFGLAIAKRIDWGTMAAYWVAQCLGGAAGAFAIKYAFPAGATATSGLGIPALNPEVNLTQGALLEMIGTFVLVTAVFGTAVSKKSPKLGALAIGLSITCMIVAFGPATGTGINPARWFGPALVTGNWVNALAFTAAPLIGGAFAAVLYQMFLAPDMDEA